MKTSTMLQVFEELIKYCKRKNIPEYFTNLFLIYITRFPQMKTFTLCFATVLPILPEVHVLHKFSMKKLNTVEKELKPSEKPKRMAFLLRGVMI